MRWQIYLVICLVFSLLVVIPLLYLNLGGHMNTNFLGLSRQILSGVISNVMLIIEDFSSGSNSNLQMESNFTHLNISDENIRLYLNFDSNTSLDNFTDYSVYNNDAIPYRATPYLTTGKYGNGIYLSGVDTNSSLRIPDQSYFSEANNNMTWSLWFKPNQLRTTNNANEWLMTKGMAVGASISYEWGLTIVGDGSNVHPRFLTWKSDGTNHIILTATSTNLVAGDWYNIVGTYNLNTRNQTLYLNGVELLSGISASNTPTDTASILTIGCRGDNVTYCFNGTIDEVMIMNKVLNKSDIALLYNQQYPLFYSSGVSKFGTNLSFDSNMINLTIYEQNNSNTLIQARVGYWNITNGFNDTESSLVASWHLENNTNDALGVSNGTWGGATDDCSFYYFDQPSCDAVSGCAWDGDFEMCMGIFIVSEYAGDLVDGKYGKAFYFDADEIEPKSISFGDKVDLPNDFTISAWINTTSEVGGTVISKIRENNAWNYELDIDASGYVKGYAGAFATSTKSVSDGEWHHIIFSRSGTTGYIYIDGVLNVTAGSQSQGANNYGLYIGAYENQYGSPTNFFNGYIDEVKIYNKSLSNLEIWELYDLGRLNYQFTPYQNLTESKTLYNFSISNSSDYLEVDINYFSNSYSSYSPLIKYPITITDYYELGEQAPPSDTTLPYFLDNTPYNMEVENDTQVIQQINATDETALDCFSLNDTYSIFEVNCSGYFLNSSQLVTGLYYFNLTINDTSDNRNYSIFYVNVSDKTILDTIAPYFIEVPENVSITYGTSYATQFNATDETGFETFVVNDTRFFVNSSGYFYNFSSLSAGTIWLNLTINDTTNNMNSTFFYVNVTQSGVSLTPYINNTYGNYTALNDTLNIWLNGTSYPIINITLYLNGSIINQGNSPLSNLTNFSAGYYNFTIFYEGSQNYTNNISWLWLNITNTSVAPPEDAEYPQFSNIQDNSNVLIDSGIVTINATVTSTNGTVILNFDGTEYLMTNDSYGGEIYNNSFNIGSSGTYQYNFTAYGNGTNNLITRTSMYGYIVKFSFTIPEIEFTALTPPNSATTENSTIDVNISITKKTNELGEVLYNWNGTNYSLYDSRVNLMYGFNSFNGINDSSIYKINLSCSDCPTAGNGKYGNGYVFNGDNNELKTKEGLSTIMRNSPMIQTIPTYDGSGQTVHPSIVYFPETWNGWKFWMCITPFTYGDDSTENPSILVCNTNCTETNGTWYVPDGLTNPVIGDPGGDNYNSDCDIEYDNATDNLFLYNRFHDPSHEVNLTISNSSDGVHWSEQNVIRSGGDTGYVPTSASVERMDDGNWYMWYTNGTGSITSYRENSTNGINWSTPIILPNQPAIYHQDVKYIKEKNMYIMTYTQNGNAGADMYFANSTDGITFSYYNQPVLYNNVTGWDGDRIYRASSWYDNQTNKIHTWYSAYNGVTFKWGTGVTNADYDDLFGKLGDNSITLSAWIYPAGATEDSGNFGGGIISKYSGTGNSYGVFYESETSKRFTFYGNGTNITTLNDYDYGNWYYLAVVSNSTYAKIYVNGILDNSGDTNKVNLFSKEVMSIGQSITTGGGHGFNGTIDEVKVYSREMTADEINKSYYSNLYQDDADSWILSINQTGLVTGESYTYYSKVCDLAGNCNNTETRTITKGEGEAPDTTSPYFTYIDNVTIEDGESVGVDFNASGELDLCYQETANISTDCGGLETGVYTHSDYIVNFENALDGNWDTYASGTGGQLGWYYVNYSKPSNALSSSLWEIKDNQGRVNLSIDEYCWNMDKLQFAVSVSNGAHVEWYCRNETGWKQLRLLSFSYYIYEEQMIWNTTDFDCFSVNDTTNFNINCSGYLSNITDLGVGTYNLNITINDSSNNVNSTIIYVNVTEEAGEDAEYPQFSDYLFGIANNSEYDDLTYQFNTTIVSTNGTAGIEFLGANYTLSNISSSFYGLVNGLSAGTYPYYFWSFGNGTDSLYNLTETFYYTIRQNSSYVLGMTKTTPIEYEQTTDFTGTGCPSQLSCSLNISNAVYGAGTIYANYSTAGNDNYSASSIEDSITINANSSYILTASGTTSIEYEQATDVSGSGCPAQLSCSLDLGNDVYGVELSPLEFNYSTAGNENYSANSDTIDITINQNNSYVLGLTATTPITYGATTDFVGSNCPSQLSCSLNVSNAVYPAGTISANYSTAGNTNYTENSAVFDVTINQATPSFTYYLNSQNDDNITTSQPYDLNASAYTDAGTIAIYVNGTDITANNGENVTYYVGYYEFIFNVSGNENYTDIANKYLYANITEAPDTIIPTFTIIPANQSITYGTSFAVQYVATDETGFGTYYLGNWTNQFQINSSGYLNNKSGLAVGEYVINVTINDTSNNQATAWYNLTINKATGLVYAYINETRDNFTSYNTTATGYADLNLTGITQTGEGEIQLILNGSIINSGSSPIYNITEVSSGYYNFTAYLPETQNYTEDYEWFYINITLTETPVCNENLANTTYTDWAYIGCIGETGYHNETRNRTQYDSNDCGYVNVTFHEYRSIANESCNAPDTTPPTWTNCRNLTAYNNTAFSQSITATDSSGIDGYFLNQTNIFNVGRATGLITNVTDLTDVQFWNMNITVNDTVGNIAQCLFWINITRQPVAVTSTNIKISPYVTNKVPYVKYNRAVKFT